MNGKEKFRLENKLGTSGVMTAVILVITTMITGFLFSVSSFFGFVLSGSEAMQRFLGAFGDDNVKIHETFDISRTISWLGSAASVIVLAAVLLLLLVIWIILYKMYRVYIYRAFRSYGVSLICIAGLLLVCAIAAGPLVYGFAGGFYAEYENVFKAGRWLALFSIFPAFILGLVMVLVSLFAMFPAKSDMKRPRRSGEKDVSFIMDDDDLTERDLHSDEQSESADCKKEEIQAVEAEIIAKKCPNCGETASDGDLFCIKCGTKL